MIYLDNAASTRCDERVIERMLPFFRLHYANSGNITNTLGIEALNSVIRSRNSVANILGCLPQQIIWTSGATEANNMAILGFCARFRQEYHGNFHMIVPSIEHKSVLEPSIKLKDLSIQVKLLQPDINGKLCIQQFEDAILDSTKLICLMLVNNELGVVNDIKIIGEICKARNIHLHCDATQAVGKFDIDIHKLKVDSMSISAHKFHGPKGVGCLFVRNESSIQPIIYGGGQENGLRSGTLNVPGIVGMSEALSIATGRIEKDMPRIGALRDRFENRLLDFDENIVVNGINGIRVPNISNITFRVKAGYNLLETISENGLIACSSGSACDTADNRPSHVMRALGKSRHDAKNTLRFSLSKFTTDAEIEDAADHIISLLKKIKK